MKSNQDPRDAQTVANRQPWGFLTWVLIAAALLSATAFVHADDGDPDTTFSGEGKAIYTWPTDDEGHPMGDATKRSVAALADG